MTPLAADTVKFLELLLSECCDGTDEHAWSKCRRCLALEEIESRQPLARKFITAAIAALKDKP